MSAAAGNPYPAGSRHHGLSTAEHVTPDGRVITYLGRRLVTDPDRLVPRAVHEVRDTERLDHVAAEHHGDPSAWWLLVEAEVADHPADIVAESGRRVRIVLPPAIQGDHAGGGA